MACCDRPQVGPFTPPGCLAPRGAPAKLGESFIVGSPPPRPPIPEPAADPAFEPTPTRFACRERQFVDLCGGSEVVRGIAVVVDGHGRGHDALPVWGDAVEPGPGDLGDETVASKLDEEPRAALAPPVCFGLVDCWLSIEAGDEVGVAEADDVVLADHDSRNSARSAFSRGRKRATRRPRLFCAGTGRPGRRRLRLSCVLPQG